MSFGWSFIHLLRPFSDLLDVLGIRNPSLDVLSAVSQISPQILEETTLPLLFTSLPDTAPAKDAESERSKYRRILSYLSVICIHPNLFDILVIRVTTKLELIFARQEGDGDKRECNAAYAYSLLSTLQTVLVTKVERGHVDVQKYVERFVPKLYELFFESAFGSKEGERVGTDSRLIGVAAGVVSAVVGASSRE
jgi:DNA repair/transcription protein MET18/MMS19